MSELFLELFSEEMPSNLQNSAKDNLILSLKSFFEKENVKFKGEIRAYSTPNRLAVYIKKISSKITEDSKEIRGPNINSPEQALEGFIQSQEIEKKNIFKKKTEKGEFYFYKRPPKRIKTIDILNKHIPIILGKIS